MTKWTMELVGQVREKAEAGLSMGQAASALGVSLSSLAYYSGLHKIRFGKLSKAELFEKRRADLASLGAKALERKRAFLSGDLKAEIALAKAEAATAPLYRGGGW